MTREQFDALPLGSIARGQQSGCALVAGKSLQDGGRGAYMTNLEGLRYPADRDFPAEILWLPDPDDVV